MGDTLKCSQMADGTWGRFHTRDSRVKQPFPTTESAIATALDLGEALHNAFQSVVYVRQREIAALKERMR